jgi:hypothetical protein
MEPHCDVDCGADVLFAGTNIKPEHEALALNC